MYIYQIYVSPNHIIHYLNEHVIDTISSKYAYSRLKLIIKKLKALGPL